MIKPHCPTLQGDAAFNALREALAGRRDSTEFMCEDVPFERLRRAIGKAELTGVERLTRFRHALRFADMTLRGGGVRRSLPLFAEHDRSQDQLVRHGLRLRAYGEVQADPWRPSWLDGSDHSDGIDGDAMMGELRPWNVRPTLADPWVHIHLGIEYYRSSAQALALRQALAMEAGTSLLVILPTGEGKSLVFEALLELYTDATVALAVPTTALALDMEHRMRRPDRRGPYAYVGGSDHSGPSATVVAALRDGTQRFVVSSPEAFLTTLREPLIGRARDGMLAAIVIDEAHLVDAWGTDFRGNYQQLSTLVAELRAAAPAGCAPRVVCLSATVTQIAFDTLRTLFCGGETLQVVSGARLRPELGIWIADRTSEILRRERVLEALALLPRPSILYVTRVRDADDWAERLRGAGYEHAAVVSSETGTAERQRVVAAWRSGELDLVVGTSAFGLGIDYAHVRAVVHACIPETPDRYYQEIGRAGRDNRAALALLLHTEEDEKLAMSLSGATVISDEKGLSRWATMFHNARRQEHDTHRLSIDVATSPRYNPYMVSERNEEWNVNVLNLMARAGLIQFAGWHRREDGSVALAVDILDDNHLDPSTWSHRVGAIRNRVYEGGQRGIEAVRSLLSALICPSNTFAELYTLDADGRRCEVTVACGGCRVCRADGRRWFTSRHRPPFAPAQIGALDPELGALFRDGRLLIEYPHDDVGTRKFERHCGDFVDALWARGLRNFIVIGKPPDRLTEALAKRPWSVASGESVRLFDSNGLPPGPAAVWIGLRKEMPLSFTAAHCAGAERLVLAYEGIDDPRRPGEPLADREHAHTFTFVIERLQR